MLWWRNTLLRLIARSSPILSFLCVLLGKEEEDGAGIVGTSVALRVHLFAEERSVQVVPAATCSLGWAGLGLPEGARK